MYLAGHVTRVGVVGLAASRGSVLPVSSHRLSVIHRVGRERVGLSSGRRAAGREADEG